MGEEELKKEENKKERRFDPELLKKGLQCDLDQYERLKCCSEKKDMTEWNEWRINNPNEEVWLEGADFKDTHLNGANLDGANLNLADLRWSGLTDKDFRRAKTVFAKVDRNRPEHARKFSEEQYKMLLHCSKKKDMTEWNEWRVDNPDEAVLLQGARLQDANLQGAKLRGAKLQGADLRGAKLQGAMLEGGNLQGAMLEHANLQGADLRGANLQGAYLGEVNLQGTYLGGVNLQGADLGDANLQDALLGETNLQGADLGVANLQGAFLSEANLQSAYLQGANLEGANLDKASLQGTDFTTAVVDGATLLWNCEINKHKSKERGTNFNGVGIASTRIDYATKQLLTYNIRRMNWEEWYKEHWFWRWPVRTFWVMSDYGMSTVRVVGVFFLLAFLFAAVYMNWGYWRPPGIIHDLVVQPEVGEAAWHYFLRAPVRAVYFSIVTMTTLGFGDMYANKGSIAGHVILAVQVILGYVLLGALITRFAVLFTAGGPAGRFAESRKGPD